MAALKLQLVNKEALVGKAAAQILDQVLRRCRLKGQGAGLGPSHNRANIVGHVGEKTGAHAGVHRGAAQGHPLALAGHLGRLGLGLDGLGLGFGLDGLRRCDLNGLGRSLRDLLRSLVYLGLVGLAHRSPLSQSMRPHSWATCSNV